MLKTQESRFASEYAHALSEYLASQSETNLRQAAEIGILARTLGVPLHELVAIHAAALLSSAADDGQKGAQASSEFLVRACQSAETANAIDHEQFLRKLAHELRSPLTTLRLSLQVSLRKLEQGEPVTAITIQKAIAQVDKLSGLIGELFHGVETGSHPVGQPRS
jgi:signal transduction histidine kinase